MISKDEVKGVKGEEEGKQGVLSYEYLLAAVGWEGKVYVAFDDVITVPAWKTFSGTGAEEQNF